MSMYSYSTRPYDPDKFFGWAAHQWTEEEISKVYGLPNRLDFWHPYIKLYGESRYNLSRLQGRK